MLKPVHTLILTCLCAGALLLAACNKKEATPAASPAPAAAPAPATPPPAETPAVSPVMRTDRMDFTLPLQPVSEGAPGFSAYSGKPTLIFYFGPTCPHCQQALPEVQAFADELKAKGYEAVAVANARSNAEEIKGFITQFKCRLPVLWDGERRFGGSYNVKVLPTLYLVKATGEYFQKDGYDGKATLDLLRSKI